MTSTNIEETNMAHNNTPDYLVQYLHTQIADSLESPQFNQLQSIGEKDIATDFDVLTFTNKQIWVWIDRSISEKNRKAIMETFQTCQKQFGRYPLRFNNNKLKIHTIVIAAYSEVAHNKGEIPMAVIGNHNDDFQLLVGYDKSCNEWFWRHETVHLMDNAYRISTKNQGSSITPDDNVERIYAMQQCEQNEDWTGFVANNWQHTQEVIDDYTKNNPWEQFVVDVLAVQYNRPKEIIKNLAHGCFQTFSANAKHNSRQRPQLKKYYKKFAQQLLPPIDDDFYRDVRQHLKADCDWIL